MITMVRPNEKRKWYGLALRHLRMASRLLEMGFSDGATFHAYHAYECVLSSFIAANGYPVPPEGWTKLTSSTGTPISCYPSPGGGIKEQSAHRARLKFFNELANPTSPYTARHRTLNRYLLLDVRMDSLYYDVRNDRLPHEVCPHSLAIHVVPEVHLFARDVWKEIR